MIVFLDSPRLAKRWHDRPGHRGTWWRQDVAILYEEILRTAAAITAARSRHRRRVSISDARLALLEALSRTQMTLGVSDLARHLRKSKQAVHRLVLALERSGLVEYWVNPDDRRYVSVSLTPRGRSAIDYANAAYAHWIIDTAPSLERRSLLRVLEILRELRARLSSTADVG
ncbi:MAG: MarR family winged helix-turn-helix transcriptional regulator [Steroidobacteraceae bacterium]